MSPFFEFSLAREAAWPDVARIRAMHQPAARVVPLINGIFPPTSYTLYANARVISHTGSHCSPGPCVHGSERADFARTPTGTRRADLDGFSVLPLPGGNDAVLRHPDARDAGPECAGAGLCRADRAESGWKPGTTAWDQRRGLPRLTDPTASWLVRTYPALGKPHHIARPGLSRR